MSGPEIIAHRGASFDAPENTIEALELALRQGASRMELDVRLTADGVPVVCHDRTLERTTDAVTVHPNRAPWAVGDLDWHELAALTTTWPDGVQPRRRCGVATLREVLDRLAGRASLLLELKAPSEHPGVLAATARALAAAPWWLDPAHPERLTVQSFDHGAIVDVRTHLPSHVRYGLLYESAPRIDDVPWWVAQLIVEHAAVDDDLVRTTQASGRDLWTWTVNEPRRMEDLVALGVDGIITDVPAVLHDVLGGATRDRGSRRSAAEGHSG